MGERLQFQEEYGNLHDMYAVSVICDDVIVGEIVSHLPHNISTPWRMPYVSSFWCYYSFSCKWSETLFSRFRVDLRFFVVLGITNG